MYIRTRDRLGQDQATWSALQTFNRPTTQQTPIGYLGNFNEHMGNDESKPCWETWSVSGFKENSAKLLDFQKKHIKDIATHIVRKLEREIKGKGEGNKSVDLFPIFEGHVDKKTDPAKYGDLAVKRAIVVYDEFADQIHKEWSKRLIFRYGYSLEPKYSEAGSTRPFGSDTKKNRRVVICVRWEIKSY